jgi:hypothetical protein
MFLHNDILYFLKEVYEIFHQKSFDHYDNFFNTIRYNFIYKIEKLFSSYQ